MITKSILPSCIFLTIAAVMNGCASSGYLNDNEEKLSQRNDLYKQGANMSDYDKSNLRMSNPQSGASSEWMWENESKAPKRR